MKKVAGRKKGTPNHSTVRRVELLAEVDEELRRMDDPNAGTPLTVMLRVMRYRLREKDYKSAVEIAALAAPYCHAKLNATDIRVHTATDRSDADIAAEIAALRAKRDAALVLPAPASSVVIDVPVEPIELESVPQACPMSD
jgi:hypothetical protein